MPTASRAVTTETPHRRASRRGRIPEQGDAASSSGHTTARFRRERQCFLDILVAGFAQSGSWNDPLSRDGHIRPEYQGIGFGRRLFAAARRDLAQGGLKSLVIWALSDNEPALAFYRALGGCGVARSSDTFGAKSLDKVAFGWNA